MTLRSEHFETCWFRRPFLNKYLSSCFLQHSLVCFELLPEVTRKANVVRISRSPAVTVLWWVSSTVRGRAGPDRLVGPEKLGWIRKEQFELPSTVSENVSSWEWIDRFAVKGSHVAFFGEKFAPGVEEQFILEVSLGIAFEISLSYLWVANWIVISFASTNDGVDVLYDGGDESTEGASEAAGSCGIVTSMVQSSDTVSKARHWHIQSDKSDSLSSTVSSCGDWRKVISYKWLLIDITTAIHIREWPIQKSFEHFPVLKHRTFVQTNNNRNWFWSVRNVNHGMFLIPV